jgi:nicotinate phosphoribosyltransferase
MPKQLDAHVFDLPVQELRRGYLSDIYFWREKITLEKHNLHPEITMQVFQKKDAVLCGVDEALAVLKLAAGRYTDYEKAYKLFDQLIEHKSKARQQFVGNHKAYLKAIEQKMEVSAQLDEMWESGFEQIDVKTLYDGARISPWETVMHITGDASLFAHLETVYLGILARRTKIASTVHGVVAAANGKIVLYFPARFDHWAVQGGDGYAAHIGGASGVSTDAQAQWWGAKASGTVPHALIAAVGGDTVKAISLFGETYPDVDLVALVDFDNDCVGTSLKCCEVLGDRLWGVRLDTSNTLIDKSIFPAMQNFKPTGVTPKLVEMTRQELDKHGFNHVRIIVSGGFNPNRIAEFEKLQVPVDAYGVGSYLMRGVNAFTADVVLLEGKPCAKVGRKYKPNPRLETVNSNSS